jgi:hypothetical protein
VAVIVVVSILAIVVHISVLWKSGVTLHEPALRASYALSVDCSELPEILSNIWVILALFELVVILIPAVVLILKHIDVVVLGVFLPQDLVRSETNISCGLRRARLVLVPNELVMIFLTNLTADDLGLLLDAIALRVLLLLLLDAVHKILVKTSLSSLSERLLTSINLAGVGFGPGVGEVVFYEVLLEGESLGAGLALE